MTLYRRISCRPVFEKQIQKTADKYLDPIKKLAAVGISVLRSYASSIRPIKRSSRPQREQVRPDFMASHGRSGIAGLLIGSETNKVLTHCKLPVLVYR